MASKDVRLECSGWTEYVLLYDIMSLLPDTQNYGLRMRRECRER